MKLYTIVPFRLSSRRFPDKPLCSLFGKTLIEHALDQADVIAPGEIILTAPEKDYETVCEKIPGLHKRSYRFFATSPGCRSATERVLELYRELDGDLFLSLPIDEPAFDAGQCREYIGEMIKNNNGAATFYCDFFCIEDAVSTLSAKIVTNNRDEILYMSRSVIPVNKNGTIELGRLKKNVGIFFFRRRFLDTLAASSHIHTELDKQEGLEQLRWLELGLTIKTKKVVHHGFGIDIPEQVKQLENRIQCLQQHMKSE